VVSFPSITRGAVGADEVIVDVEHPTVSVSVLPNLEAPKTGSSHIIKSPQNRSIIFVSYPQGFWSPSEWFAISVLDDVF
jgi:hypothetical protein